MTRAALILFGEFKFDITERVGFMIEFNDPQWGLCDRDLAAGDFRYDDDEDYEDEDEEEYGDEWDGYDDEAAIEGMARLAAEIEPGRATVAQWAEAIRRRGAERRRQPWR
jgi:hypothetical protein